MVLQTIAVDECIDFIYPSFDNPPVVIFNNCILVSLNEIMNYEKHEFHLYQTLLWNHKRVPIL